MPTWEEALDQLPVLSGLGFPAAWVAADEVYGADPQLRQTVREHGLGYVLQVSANRRVPNHAGPIRVNTLAITAPDTAWQTYSSGTGSKAPRYYAWAWIALTAILRCTTPSQTVVPFGCKLEGRAVLPDRSSYLRGSS